MTSKERVLAALSLKEPDRVPYMELGIDGRVAQRALGGKPVTASNMLEAFKLDGYGATVYPQLAATYGSAGDGDVHYVGGKMAGSQDIGMAAPGDVWRDIKNFDHVKRLVEEIGQTHAVFAATNIGLDPVLLGLGIENFSYVLADEPEFIEQLLDIYCEWSIRVCERFQQCGVDIIWFTDDIAFNDSTMFSPGFFSEVCVPKLKQVLDTVKVPTIYHSDGNILPVIKDLIGLGFNGLHPMDPGGLDINQVKKDYGSQICLLGNIDLRHTLVDGTLDEVRGEVWDRIRHIGAGGGYIMTSANTVPSYCKAENVLEIGKAIDAYYGR